MVHSVREDRLLESTPDERATNMEELMRATGEGYVCAGRRGPYDGPGVAEYAFYAVGGAVELDRQAQGRGDRR